MREVLEHFWRRGILLRETWVSALLSHHRDVGKVEGYFLGSNIRDSLDPGSPGLSSLGRANILCQVVACCEIGSSVTQQVNQMEESSSHSTTTRIIHDEEEPSHTQNDVSKKMVKCILEDHTGARVFAIDQISIPSLNAGMPLGAKLILHSDIPIVHGVLLLKPTRIDWLGGAIEAWNSGDRVKTDLYEKWRTLPTLTATELQRGQEEEQEDEYDPGEVGDEQAARTYRGRGRATRSRGRRAGNRGSRGGRH